MRRVSLSLVLVACGPANDEIGAAIDRHAAQTDVHGGPFATPVEVTAEIGAAVAAHDADDDAHGGPFTTPDALVSAVDDASAALEALLEAHASDPEAHPDLPIALEQLPTRTHSLSIPFSSVFSTLNTTVRGTGFGGSGAFVADGGKFAIGFTVPAEYESGDLTLNVGWRIDETGCTVALSPNFLDRARAGSVPPTGSATAGLSGPGALAAPAPPMTGVVGAYRITAGGGYPDLRPGDQLVVGLNRATDSCVGEVAVTGFEVTWQGR